MILISLLNAETNAVGCVWPPLFSVWNYSVNEVSATCVCLQAPQFVDIPLAEEDSSDDEYHPEEEEEDETAEDVRLQASAACCDVDDDWLLIFHWLCVCVDVPGEWHGEHSFVSSRDSAAPSWGGQLQPMAGPQSVIIAVSLLISQSFRSENVWNNQCCLVPQTSDC